MQRIFVFVASFLLCFGPPARFLLATDYYVTNNQADIGGADGSAGNPWGTITQALTSGAFAPGDVVHVAAGGYSDNWGETFPFLVPDGVTLQGAGAGASVINQETGGDPIFRFGSPAGTTTIAGFSIDASSTIFEVTGQPNDLRILDNAVNGYISDPPYFLYYSEDGGGSAEVTLSGNSLQFIDGTAVYWAAFDGAGPHTINIRNNDFVYGSSDAVHVSAYSNARVDLFLTSNLFALNTTAVGFLAYSNATLNQTIRNNWFENNDYDWTGWFYANTDSASQTGTIVMEGNHFQAQTAYQWYLLVWAENLNSITNVTLNASGNVLEGGTSTEISISVSAANGGEASLGGTIECNDFINHYHSGFNLYVNASGGGSLAECDLLFNYNRFNGCEEYGVFLSGVASDLGEVRMPVGFHGNTMLGNHDLGVVVSLARASNAVLAGVPDFGGGPVLGMPGLNTIRGNELRFSPSTNTIEDFLLRGTGGLTVSATGNFWVNDVSADIEAAIEHDGPGDTGVGHVNYSGFLAPTIDFTGPASAEVGYPVTLVAEPGNYFLPKAGTIDILVLVDGIPASSVVVSPDYSMVDFIVPPGVFNGAQQVVVHNPGGQIGSITMALSGGVGQFLLFANSSRCFIATAAHGDDDAPEVLLLRRWRDECLASNPVGRQLIQAYYSLSPGLAEAVAESPPARFLTRAALAPVVGAVKLWLQLPWAYGLLAAAMLWRILRRQPRES